MANCCSALDNGDNALVRWFGYLVYATGRLHPWCVREQVTGAYFLDLNDVERITGLEDSMLLFTQLQLVYYCMLFHTIFFRG